MVPNFSRKSIISIQWLCNFCAIFGLMPFYSFANKRFKLKRTCFMVFMSLICIVITGTAADTIYRIVCIDEFRLVHFMVMVSEFFGLLIWLVAAYQSCFKHNTWQEIFNGIQYFEDHNNDRIKERNIWKNTNLQFIVTVILVITILIYERITFNDSNQNVFLFNSSYIYFFLHFLLSTIIGNMALIIKNKFQNINRMLLTYEDTNLLKLLKGTRKVQDLYLQATTVIEYFNKLFGPLLFLMGLHCSALMLQFSVFVVYNMFDKEQQHDDYSLLIIGVVDIFLMLLWLGVTMFCCDNVVAESERIITICYKIQLKHSIFSVSYRSINNLLYVVTKKKVKFTAMDYYEIQRSTMFGVIGTTATYFVVLIQFYDGNKKRPTV
ncbi:hypothetical protein ABEB36_004401 [Hypothenemus hampei]|uniref:Gustatory receptor n=1 Tax=Hypothenemus hampei TaxID=57062 RepID=A0ABD1F358_HYPHA